MGAGGRVGRYAVRWFLWLRMARKLFDPSHVPGDLGKSGLRNFGKLSFDFWKLFLGVLFGADPYCDFTKVPQTRLTEVTWYVTRVEQLSCHAQP